MKATDFQKNLFALLEKAAKGDPVFIEHEGVSFRLQAVSGASKGARSMKREAILGDAKALNASDKDLMAHLKMKWAKENS